MQVFPALPGLPPLADNRGAAALEFAILAPVCLLFDGRHAGLRRLFRRRPFAAATGRRCRPHLSRRLDPAERQNLVAGFLDRNADDYVLIGRAGLSYEIGPKPNDPDEYRVTLHYNAAKLPIWNLYPPLPLPSPIITYVSVVRLGGI